MNQRIEYGSGTEDQNTTDSIEPLEDGESVTSAVLNRPSENLRERTETVRDALDENLYLRDADRAFMPFNGGTIEWNGHIAGGGLGTFTTSADLWLLPFNTAGNSGSSPPVGSTFGTMTIERTGPADGIIVTSKKRNYEKGDKISVEILLDAGISGNTEIEVQDDTRIKITVKATTTLNQVITDVAADIDANALVGMALAGGAAGSDTLVTTQAEEFVVGNWDSEAHVITAATFASFFGTAANKLQEGDSICVYYNENIEGTIAGDSGDPKGGALLGGRRESMPENLNTNIPSGSLFNSREEPEKLSNAIPIAKVISDTLYFTNGVAFEKDVPSSLNSATAYVHVAGDTMTGNLLPNATGLDLGSTGARWDVFAQAVNTSTTLTVGTDAVVNGNASVIGSFDANVVTGITHIHSQGTLNVDDDATFDSDIIVANNADIAGDIEADNIVALTNLEVGVDLTVIGDILGDTTVTGDFDAASVETAEADIRHAARTLVLSADAGTPYDIATPDATYVGATSTNSSYWDANAAGGSVTFWLPCYQGDTVTTVSLRLLDTAQAITVTAYRVNPFTQSRASLDTDTSAGNSTFQTKTLTLNFTVPANETIVIEGTFNATFAGQRIYGASVVTTRS